MPEINNETGSAFNEYGQVDNKLHPDDYRLPDGRWMRRTSTSDTPGVKTWKGPPPDSGGQTNWEI